MDALMLEFLRDGNLGGLRLYMKSAEVKALLGECQYGGREKKILVWKYQDLELMFNRADELVHIGIDFYEGIAELPQALTKGDGKVRLGGASSVRDGLESISVPVHIYPPLTFESQSCLIVPCGAHIIHQQPEDEISTIQLSLLHIYG